MRQLMPHYRASALPAVFFLTELVGKQAAPRYAQTERITLVCDNLNTHRLTSLYQAFEPAEALRIVGKLQLVHTPKHGSWLNMAEPEWSVLTR